MWATASCPTHPTCILHMYTEIMPSTPPSALISYTMRLTIGSMLPAYWKGRNQTQYERVVCLQNAALADSPLRLSPTPPSLAKSKGRISQIAIDVSPHREQDLAKVRKAGSKKEASMGPGFEERQSRVLEDLIEDLELEKVETSPVGFNCLTYSAAIANGELTHATQWEPQGIALAQDMRVNLHEDATANIPEGADKEQNHAWYKGYDAAELERVFRSKDFMGEPHLYALANRRGGCPVVTIEKRAATIEIILYQKGYGISQSLSDEQVQALFNFIPTHLLRFFLCCRHVQYVLTRRNDCGF